MTLPALFAASKDRALKGSPITVYVWLIHNLLDVETFKPIKIDGLAAALEMKPETTSRSVRALVDGGYIERRYVKRAGYSYRLRWARDTPKVA